MPGSSIRRPATIDGEIGALISRSDFIRQSVASRLWCHETNISGVATGAGPEVIPMRANPTIANNCILASLIGLLAFACFGFPQSPAAPETRQPIAIQISFDRPIDASASPFVLASVSGLFGSEGLAGTTHIDSRSEEADTPVARGDNHFAPVCIHEVIR